VITNRKKSALLGFATDLGGQFLLIAVNFVAIPVILKMTSASLYGFWVTTLSILGFLSLADFGLGVSLTRLVAGRANDENPDRLNRIVSSAFVVFCMIGAALLLLGLSLLPFFPVWFRIPSGEIGEVRIAYAIALFSGAVVLPLTTFSAVISGFQRMAVDNTIRIAMSVAATGLSIVLLLLNFGILALAISGLFQSLSIGAINFAYVRRRLPKVRVRTRLVDRERIRELLTFGGYFQLGRIANTVATSADSLIISSCLGTSLVVPYSITSKLAVTFSNGVASKAPLALFPAISQMFADREYEKLRNIFIRLAQLSTRLAIIAGAFLVFANRSFVSLWVGKEFYGGSALNYVFVFWVLQDTIYRGTTAIVYASGELKGWMYASLLEAAINLAVSVVLVYKIGILGVALGTSIGKIFSTAAYVPYWICRKLDMKVGRFLREGILYPALKSVPGILALSCFLFLAEESVTWWRIVSIAVFLFLGNVLLFEGYGLLTSPGLSFRERLRQVMMY